MAEGERVDFQARLVDDRPADECAITWSSNLAEEPLNTDPADPDGVIQFSTTELPAGINVVTVKVVDVAGNSGEDSITVYVRTAEELDGDGDWLHREGERLRRHRRDGLPRRPRAG